MYALEHTGARLAGAAADAFHATGAPPPRSRRSGPLVDVDDGEAVDEMGLHVGDVEERPDVLDLDDVLERGDPDLDGAVAAVPLLDASGADGDAAVEAHEVAAALGVAPASAPVPVRVRAASLVEARPHQRLNPWWWWRQLLPARGVLHL